MPCTTKKRKDHVCGCTGPNLIDLAQKKIGLNFLFFVSSLVMQDIKLNAVKEGNVHSFVSILINTMLVLSKYSLS
jgi:hypothetical protein